MLKSSEIDRVRSAKDRRRADRFPIEQEVRYRIRNKRQQEHEGSGKTVNISSSGVLITTSQVLVPGKRVELAISWPVRLDNRCALKLVAKGRVSRLEQGRAAIEIQHYEFHTQASKALTA
ncbi:MAG: PilZ domain-containing protein [Acidobacteria bacterium]|nr:PilZ domain-containing protein [Acidobacteriota bacterium]MBI3282108.1 PilZ domain-containing protein [Acidobacteriota bacterium]